MEILIGEWRRGRMDVSVELYRCPKCGHIDDADNFDVLGADGDQQFCNHCHHEHVLAPFRPSSKGGDPAEWPADLRVREYPKTNPAASAG